MTSTTVFSTTDRYAALKDLDEQLRDDKSQSQCTQSVQEHQPNPFKLQNGNFHSISNPFQVLGETKMNYNSGAIDNERYDGSNDFSQMHQRNPFQVRGKLPFVEVCDRPARDRGLGFGRIKCVLPKTVS